ncbi:hypothetical protein HMN09_01328000 [Mycena chlorophos]|uniref:Uncharacterized protein n=1 Tax=Mycena chlorophos TaxID=658473 RepID=A0A8H6RXM7_MYCCL|nr:hypothetical protein HMN09_01328000 [Mycena chlorophos]
MLVLLLGRRPVSSGELESPSPLAPVIMASASVGCGHASSNCDHCSFVSHTSLSLLCFHRRLQPLAKMVGGTCSLRLPVEILDHIIDCMVDDDGEIRSSECRNTLLACSLIPPLSPRSRHHVFHEITLLASTVDNFADILGSPHATVNNHVRMLTLHHSSPDTFVPGRFGTALASGLLPNVATLRIVGKSWHWQRVSFDFLKPLARSVKTLLVQQGVITTIPQFCRFFTVFPALQALHLIMFDPCTEEPLPVADSSRVRLPQMHKLAIPSFAALPILPLLDVPSLTSLTLFIPWWAHLFNNIPVSEVVGFLERVAPTLEHLRMHYPSYVEDSASVSRAQATAPLTDFSRFGRLRTLDLRPMYDHQLALMLTCMSIKSRYLESVVMEIQQGSGHLSLRNVESALRQDCYAKLDAFFADKARFPRLAFVKIRVARYCCDAYEELFEASFPKMNDMGLLVVVEDE